MLMAGTIEMQQRCLEIAKNVPLQTVMRHACASGCHWSPGDQMPQRHCAGMVHVHTDVPHITMQNQMPRS